MSFGLYCEINKKLMYMCKHKQKWWDHIELLVNVTFRLAMAKNPASQTRFDSFLFWAKPILYEYFSDGVVGNLKHQTIPEIGVCTKLNVRKFWKPTVLLFLIGDRNFSAAHFIFLVRLTPIRQEQDEKAKYSPGSFDNSRWQTKKFGKTP